MFGVCIHMNNTCSFRVRLGWPAQMLVRLNTLELELDVVLKHHIESFGIPKYRNFDISEYQTFDTSGYRVFDTSFRTCVALHTPAFRIIFAGAEEKYRGVAYQNCIDLIFRVSVSFRGRFSYDIHH